MEDLVQQESSFASTREGYLEAKQWLQKNGHWERVSTRGFSTDGWSIVEEANRLMEIKSRQIEQIDLSDFTDRQRALFMTTSVKSLIKRLKILFSQIGNLHKENDELKEQIFDQNKRIEDKNREIKKLKIKMTKYVGGHWKSINV